MIMYCTMNWKQLRRKWAWSILILFVLRLFKTNLLPSVYFHSNLKRLLLKSQLVLNRDKVGMFLSPIFSNIKLIQTRMTRPYERVRHYHGFDLARQRRTMQTSR